MSHGILEDTCRPKLLLKQLQMGREQTPVAGKSASFVWSQPVLHLNPSSASFPLEMGKPSNSLWKPGSTGLKWGSWHLLTLDTQEGSPVMLLFSPFEESWLMITLLLREWIERDSRMSSLNTSPFPFLPAVYAYHCCQLCVLPGKRRGAKHVPAPCPRSSRECLNLYIINRSWVN